MRQGQQNRRGRGRNHNHQQRKNHNPLSRSYESNGPDVKLRGTPNHIAEKYLSLARDAQSSGDPVLAENYLQHAEHYNRIIMAYREQNFPQGGDPNLGGGNGGFGEHGGSEETGLGALDAEASEEGFVEPLSSRGGGAEDRMGDSGLGDYDSSTSRMQPDQARAHYQHQGQRERNYSEGRGGGGYHDRRDRRDRHEGGRDRGDRRDRSDHRFERRDRSHEDRSDRYQPQSFGGETRGEPFQSPQRRDRNGEDRLPQDTREQPEFLRRSVRRSKPELEGETENVTKVVASKERSGRE